MDTAITVSEVSKQYRLGEFGVRTFTDDLRRRFKNFGPVSADGSSEDYFYALKDVSFDVQSGDIVGLIGANGAGKSTLLKILSQVTTPTSGTVRGKGRVSSLLEVGTGFHPELTGRENIYLNGAIMGMSREEIRRNIDDIIEFAGCGRHVDTPIKRYSSGMVVRLGFAVAAHLDCEIMIVDEVLAVGDRAFRSQAVEKMKAISKESGRTILFVSHNLGTVREFCRSGLVMDAGRLTQYDTIEKALSEYVSRGDDQSFERTWEWEERPQITAVRVDPASVSSGELVVEIDFRSPHHIAPEPGVVLYNDDLTPVMGTNVRMHRPRSDFPRSTEGTVRCDYGLLPLHDGRYHLSVWLGDGEADVDSVEFAVAFDFSPLKPLTAKPDTLIIGPLHLAAAWSMTQPEADR